MNLENTQPEGDLTQKLEGGRNAFIKKVYGHLFLAIVGFIFVEYLMFTTKTGIALVNTLLGIHWGLILGGFVLLGWIARQFASGHNSLSKQYLGLILYIIGEGIIFAPLLAFVILRGDVGGDILQQAGLITLVAFFTLTAVVFLTKKDFSFLRTFLVWIGIIAFIAIVAALIFNITLGIGFSIAMVAFSGAAILYDTSNIRKHYPEDQYVGAAVDLFASVALMFWYVLSIFLNRD